MLSLIMGLVKEGHDVRCIISAWGNGTFEELLISEKLSYYKLRLGFISKTLDLKAVKMTLDQFAYWPGLLISYKKILSSFRPEMVIHSNFHHLFLLYTVIGRKRIKNIYHSHESINNTKFYRRMFQRFEKKITAFIGVSEYVSGKLNLLGIPAGKIRTIHNGVKLIAQETSKTTDGDVFRIGIAGQIGDWKGHEDLLLALAALKHTNPELKFKLAIFGAGDNTFIDELKVLIDQKKLNDVVEWKGFVKDIKLIYGGLDLVCIPSRSEEPFATSALEAGLYSVPVIVTNKGGFPEIVRNGYNGYIVEAYAPEAIAKNLYQFMNNRGLAVKMGSNHRRVITEKFTLDLFINNWQKTLLALVETAG